MIVVGGYYREVCVSPPKDEHFGSGGRAAIAIAMAGIEVDWHYYCPEDLQGAAGFGLGGDGVRHHQHSSADLIRFEYFHPLSAPIFSPAAPARQDAIRVEGDAILRFGLMEGDAVVNGAKVVFDPQSPNQPVSFRANGSKADRLAIVLNNKEVLALGESDEEAQAVRKVIEREKAEIVLVKGGAQGCRVYMDGVLKGSVPPYRTDRVYKIGSGDVFSAAFTYHWALEGLDPVEAADAASRCVARYCDRRLPSVVLDETTANLEPAVAKNLDATVYIAGPFFTMAELWLVEEACTALHGLGARYFSPYHEAGLLGDYEDSARHRDRIKDVVAKDLDGLAGSAAVFAILDGCDPGTLFEIGWAVERGIPVIALSQNPKPADQTMLLGSGGCSISDDFASAIYRAAWAAWKG